MIQAHKTDENRYVVSENGVWVPGIYDSAETAKKAPKLTDEEIVTHLGHIFHADKEDRAVTLDELNALLAVIDDHRLKAFHGEFVEHEASE
jgi:hypothetical protein